MNLPSCSVVLTIHERPTEVLTAVFNSLPLAGRFEQLIIVRDRMPEHLKEWIVRATALFHPKPTFVDVEGPPGWICPARAWNAGFNAIESETAYVFSSEVIHRPDNIWRARGLLATTQGVIFGAANESEPGKYDHTEHDGILCSSEKPRALGFIMALPTWMLRATGGMDEGFMGGYWYDDDDFTFRLWRLGMPFIFTDAIHGIHQSHPRPVLATAAGKDGIARNLAYITAKWGSAHPLDGQPRSVVQRPGLTVWFPHHGPGLLDARVRAWELPTTPEGKIQVVH